MTTASPQDFTCATPGCTNRRAKIGYGRLHRFCERHRHERYGMDYQKGEKGVRSKTKAIKVELRDILQLAARNQDVLVAERLTKLLKEKYK